MSSGSRRQFVQAAGAAGLVLASAGGRAAAFSLEDAPPLRPGLLPSADELGRQTVEMNSLGERFTGSEAHRKHIEYLAKGLGDLGLDVRRDTAPVTRWLARTWAGRLTPAGGAAVDLPATSYYPYSGVTGPEGVTGELVQIPLAFSPESAGGRRQIAAPGDLRGKVAFIEVPALPSPLTDTSKPAWGFNPEGAQFPTHLSAVWGGITPGLLGDLKKAGVVGAILGWTNISDAQAHGQYTPYGRPLQDLPCIWVGRASTARLRAAAGTGAKATVILQADVATNVPVDTLYTVLPGMSSDSTLFVTTQSDGMNFFQENGSLGVLAMAKYFSRLPRQMRKRDIVIVIANRFCNAPPIHLEAWMERHADIYRKTAAWMSVEHLGCREWFDNAAGEYAPSGKDEMTFAITDFKGVADATLAGARGGSSRLAVTRGPRVPGEGSPMYRTGLPGIAFFPAPNYLLAFGDNGHIEKFDKALMHAQVVGLTRTIQKLDGMSAEQLRAS
ncbi:hypothetical protein [Phenylobacterium sp.]|uniref:hypothetical protein n=1 Tax=Phenylobacterium sp. TaxID=1871053 RepID=UPI0025EB77C4|nr:hypothetical protein [Phenylobacterium sp.]MBX3484899.1 hypothetical protein [Phenylobacterium sp.]